MNISRDKLFEILGSLFDLAYTYTDPLARSGIVFETKIILPNLYHDLKEYFNLDLPILENLTINNIDERSKEISNLYLNIFNKHEILKKWHDI